jgi:hypothetical protein
MELFGAATGMYAHDSEQHIDVVVGAGVAREVSRIDVPRVSRIADCE